MEDISYSFCPECGAVARNGICTSCGRKNQFAYSPLPGTMGTPPKKNNTGLTIAAIIGALLMLIMIVVVSVLMMDAYKKKELLIHQGKLNESHSYADSDDSDENAPHIDSDEDDGEDEEFVLGDSDKELKEKLNEKDYIYSVYNVTKENQEEEGQDKNNPYYSGPYNDLKDDLPYEVVFEKSNVLKVSPYIELDVEYPQIVSDTLDNKDYINAILKDEFYWQLEYYWENVRELVEEKGQYTMVVDSYVTYMDEDILSVVYYESLVCAADGEYISDISFYCVNIDLETGMVMDNQDILALNEEFAIEFRKREAEENGNEALVDYSDQEILDMLKDDYRLVIFYTPRGLEVGLNLDQRIVYVEFSDYEKYLNKY